MSTELHCSSRIVKGETTKKKSRVILCAQSSRGRKTIHRISGRRALSSEVLYCNISSVYTQKMIIFLQFWELAYESSINIRGHRANVKFLKWHIFPVQYPNFKEIQLRRNFYGMGRHCHLTCARNIQTTVATSLRGSRENHSLDTAQTLLCRSEKKRSRYSVVIITWEILQILPLQCERFEKGHDKNISVTVEALLCKSINAFLWHDADVLVWVKVWLLLAQWQHSYFCQTQNPFSTVATMLYRRMREIRCIPGQDFT